MPTCIYCGSSGVETDAAQGNAYCTNCGVLFEENTIVSEVTFGETAGGAAVLQGQFVSADRSSAALGGGMGLGYARRLNPNESREMTMAQGKRRLQALASALRLSEHYIDMAHRFYVLALQNNFCRGRKSQSVAAACMYIVCRQEKTSHMLLDFADVLQANVFVLGNTFLKLTRLLNLSLPIVEPTLYVARFAAKMQLGEKTHTVAQSAMRLVSRMKRDWIETGRRPTGICGACLLIAARMHGFERTEREMIAIVRTCEVTLRKRLYEFGNTPTSQLTPDEFESIWLESSADPPAFTRNQETRKRTTFVEVATNVKPANEEASDEAVVVDEDQIIHDDEAQTGAPLETVGSLTADLRATLIYATNTIQSTQDSAIQATPQDSALNSGINTPSIQTSPVKLSAANAEVNTDLDQDWSDLDRDPEVSAMLLEDHEAALKASIWQSLYGDHEREQEEKRAAAAAAQDDNGAMLTSTGRKKRTQRIRRGFDGQTASVTGAGAPTAEMAAGAMVQAKRLSRKINYEALGELFNASRDMAGNNSSNITSTAKPVTDTVASNVPPAIPEEDEEEAVLSDELVDDDLVHEQGGLDDDYAVYDDDQPYDY